MLGDEIKNARKKLGISQEELADRAGLHRTYISLLERNKKSPTIDVFLRICKALEVSASLVIKKLEK